jgi:hypothetical protein
VCRGPQLERAEVRLEGIDTMLRLASKSFLLPSVQYAMLCGWQRVIPEGTNIGYVVVTVTEDDIGWGGGGWRMRRWVGLGSKSHQGPLVRKAQYKCSPFTI